MSTALVALELAEMQAFVDLYESAEKDAVEACGLSVAAVGPDTLFTANRIDVLALNRLLGLGLNGAVTDASLSSAIDAFRHAGAPRYFVSLAPVDGSDMIRSRLEQRGLRHYNNWMRLEYDLRQASSLDDPPTTLTVRRIGRDEAGAFGRIVTTAFGYPPAMASLPGQTVERPNWHHYLAYDGEVPVGAAAMYVVTDAAWFGFAATDAAHRRNGAQHALVVRRGGSGIAP